MKMRKSSLKLLRILLLACLLTLLSAAAAFADEWGKSGSDIYYTITDENGSEVKAKGLTEIAGKMFYFNAAGVLQTGWVSTEDGLRYFRKTGDLGTKGVMFTGLKTISKKKYYFDKETGVQQTGLIKAGKYTYYFKKKKSTKAGVSGAALVKTFATYQGSRYYFNAKGRMVTNKWVSGYYFGADGKKLVSTVTPDSYLVDKNGKKVRKVKTGLIEINGTTYYWSKSQKKFLTNTTKKVKGVTYVIDENGVATKQKKSESGEMPKILIVAGHGQGDTGAVGIAQEYLKTREFAALIYEKLFASGKVDVTYLKDGSTAYDLYQKNAAALKGVTVKGTGSNKKKVKKVIKKKSSLPKLYNYDYVLEVHFNATAAASKDLKGDGDYKGFGFYINQYKKSTTLETAVCAKIKALGFKAWGGGVVRSGSLFNARVCQELGVDYSLVETAFIDDKDDMDFYEKNKEAMAQAIADGIISCY